MGVRRIIGLFGGIRPMARQMSQALGRRVPATTIQGWSDRGTIPSRRQDEVMAAARECGIALGFADFFDGPEASGVPRPPGPEEAAPVRSASGAAPESGAGAISAATSDAGTAPVP
ncbi:MAG: hypothetical protein O7D31_11730, partial [Alphaproteobacteria bacterium]|nr:hypothetical protein [Alphaproteobacteria bacterium]